MVYTRLVHVNPTTVALTFLLGILFAADRLGLRYAIFMSLLAALALNLFFLPPVGTLTIADSQNWIALLAFLTAGILASHLSERARNEALNADRRRNEVERLYEFSQHILASERIEDLLNNIPVQISSTFQNESVAIFLSGNHTVYRSPDGRRVIGREELEEIADRTEMVLDQNRDICLSPLMLGLRSIGTLGIQGNLPSRETIEALGSLIAIAIERGMTADQLSHTEAARESERLRSALLDSVTHELRTPLTAITASITSLRSGVVGEENTRQELLAVIEEESARLNRLIGQAVEMAQLDAQQIQLNFQEAAMREVVENAIEQSGTALKGHPLQARIPDNLPKVRMDVVWIQKVLRHLLENAAKYSPADGPIFVSAEVQKDKLVTSVADRGPGIEDLEKAMIFDKFYRGSSQRHRVHGTGMGLAIVKAIIDAHGGQVEVTSQLGVGSVFSFQLPLLESNREK